MKKNLFLRLCLILVVAITTYSCRTDQFPENETFNDSSKFRLTSKRISLNEAKHKAQLVPEIEKAETEIKAYSKNAHGKSVDLGNGILINTDNVIYMENGPDYHTYTFSIQRSNPLANAPVENLVLTPLPDGGYKAYLVTYSFSEAEKNIILNGGNVSLNGKSTVTPLEGTFVSVMSVENCTMQLYESYTLCSEGVHNHGEVDPKCKADHKSQYIAVMVTVCQGGLPSQPVIEGPIDGGPDGGGGSSSATPCSANGVYLQPQDPANSDCNGGVVTQPIIEFNPPKTPCQKIKEQRNDEGFKKRMDTLKGKTGLTKETGYIQKWGGNYEYKANGGTTSTANTLTLPEVASHTYIKAYMHTHIDDIPNSERKGIKMFSPADASYLMNLVQNAQTNGHSLSDPYGVMVTSTGNYQIRFTGNQYQIKTFTENELDTHNELFGAGMKEYLDNPKQLEMRFLKYIQKEMLLYGITLYRMNTDGTTTEIKLNADKTDTVENTCPN